ncbi:MULTISPECIES: biotin transporter BioY [unclassified Paenibacillus]|uniref:biotin transporter BioY n=1 Tax=unclassified Paenibacillus TaxID=185978 RepID=UPI000954F4E9|nr:MULTISPECIES: biotin transporter BioY [unclassified Paenibacillus]SIQ28919.1 biotin transport system substrate-specific component [Paenibacillus sp. RU4X]SIQ51055.1 biotin transport system substrate-specific component [Paenibacillus sp. RU4T]
MLSSSQSLRRAVFIALFGALFVVFNAITISTGVSSLVPFTLQTMAVALVGAFIGGKDGFLSILLVNLLALAGLPLYRGHGGLAHMTGPTGGFIWFFPISALIIGLLVTAILRSKAGRHPAAAFALILVVMETFGSLFVYVGGIPWMMQVTGLPFDKAMAVGCYPFLLPDLLKNVAAAAITVALRSYLPVMRLKSRSRAFSAGKAA